MNKSTESTTGVSKPKAQSKSVACPYPGLRFYDDDQKVTFAGRDEQIATCADAIRKARLVILHGRTGCGKSSFLRAGVKPYLSKMGSAINFADGPGGGLSVIRSTDTPLQAFADALLEAADLLGNPETAAKTGRTFGSLADDVDPALVRKAFPSDAAFQKRLRTKAEAAFASLKQLSRLMAAPPVFIIDQAEEIFTLNVKRNSEAEDVEAEDREREYFHFLHMVASQDVRAHIVISLRTEYKGLFDDKIVHFGHPGRQLLGYYLPELELDGLTEAILRPTIRSDSKEWPRIKHRLGLPEKTAAPGDAAGGLRISKKTAEELARTLLSDKVPVGGILPTLQAACIRLWNQSSGARRARPDHIIEPTELRRLGEIETQVEQYLLEALEEACSKTPAWTADLPGVVSRWLRSLRDLMVTVEADGRAVTRSLDRAALVKRISDQLSSDEENETYVNDTLEQLLKRDVGVLKHENGRVTLGHDSLALALHKWSLSAPRESGSMMMRMGMATMENLRHLKIGDLFLNEDQPHRTTIVAAEDFNWERQLPHFAQKRGFAERLGIRIVKSDDLSAPKGVAQKKSRWGWDVLKKSLVEKDENWAKGGRYRWDGDNERFMVAAEVDAFPGAPPKEPGEEDTRVKYAWRWSDVLVTNLFLGNALIGPDQSIAVKLADAMKVQESSLDTANTDEAEEGTNNPFVKAVESAVVSALEAVLKEGGNIQCADESGRELLVFAARLCNRQDLAEKFRTLSTLKVQPSKNYEVRDPLIEFMLGAKGEEQRFLIGPAATRAMADHAGFHCYFGAQELAILAHKEMKRRQAIDYRIKTLREMEDDGTARKSAAALRTKERARRKGITDLAAEVQKIVSHTVWHVGLPASSWNQGLNRAFILRFASIGYFTSEYVRTSMEDFIGHVHEFVNATFELTADTKDSMSGQRLARPAVKEAIAECYKFLKFDEFGPTVFDLDSLYAYWSDHGNMQTRSIAGEVYRELVSLRQQTIAHYMMCAEAIGWMRYSGKYNPSHEDISAAYRLKELAWNNFNIYNFYDSERYMSRAADKLRGCMEADFQEAPRKKDVAQTS